MNRNSAPSLDQLAADPARVRDLPSEGARALLLQLAPLQEALRLRALSPPAGANGQPEGPAEGDRLLTVEEAGKRLGVSNDWLYRQARKLPFTVRLGRQLRFSEHGIERYIRQRQGR